MGDFENWVAEYTKYVDRILAIIPYKRMATWKEFFFSPVPTLNANMDSVGQRVKDLVASQLVGMAVGLIGILPMLLLFAVLNPFIILIGLVFIVIGIPLGIVLSLAFALLFIGLEYAVAKILGGAADFRGHFNASTLPGLSSFVMNLPLHIAAVPLMWLMVIPVISCCFTLLSYALYIPMFLILLYTLYLKYLSFREVHKFDGARAAATVILPIVVMFVLILAIYLLVVVFYFASIFTLLGSMPSGGTLG
ncbi:MAG: hypothetical protein AB1324_02115 [Candidatus Micrarchaeota archaeon]